MSRIGIKPITVPSGVTVTVGKDNDVTVKGPKGELSSSFSPRMAIAQDDGTITVSRPNDQRENKALHGLTRTLLNNMVVGVTDGFTKNLEIMSTTLQQVDEIDEKMVDRLAALGMISVFDVEEIGAEMLATELELSPEVAAKAVELASERAKIVAEEQAREKEEAEKRRQEEQARIAAGEDLLGPEGAPDADSAAAAILGGGAATSGGGMESGGKASSEGTEAPESSESQAGDSPTGDQGDQEQPQGGENDSNGDSRAAEILGG